MNNKNVFQIFQVTDETFSLNLTSVRVQKFFSRLIEFL